MTIAAAGGGTIRRARLWYDAAGVADVLAVAGRAQREARARVFIDELRLRQPHLRRGAGGGREVRGEECEVRVKGEGEGEGEGEC